jgi:DNA-binding NarL/FixJ family response regulator
MIRVIIADDHPLTRKGIEITIDQHPGVVIVGQAGTGEETLEMLGKSGADIVLLDISMPGLDGLAAIRKIQESYPRTKVIVVTMHPEEKYGLRALKMGAQGYVMKDMASRVLQEAVQKVAEGGRYISPKLAELMAGIIVEDRALDPHEILSDREFQVLRLLAQGQNQRDIAEYLAISPKTVSTYRTRILEKLGLETTAELMRYALEREIAD